MRILLNKSEHDDVHSLAFEVHVIKMSKLLMHIQAPPNRSTCSRVEVYTFDKNQCILMNLPELLL